MSRCLLETYPFFIFFFILLFFTIDLGPLIPVSFVERLEHSLMKGPVVTIMRIG